MDTATETGIDAAKTASKRVVQKTAEATGDLIGTIFPQSTTFLFIKFQFEIYQQDKFGQITLANANLAK